MLAQELVEPLRKPGVAAVAAIGVSVARPHDGFVKLDQSRQVERSSRDHQVCVRRLERGAQVVELRERYFTPPYPADTIVEVSALALPELEFEIEAVALASGEIVG